jgi:hypothetical protein
MFIYNKNEKLMPLCDIKAFFKIFVYGLFNDVSSSGYITSHGIMMNEY